MTWLNWILIGIGILCFLIYNIAIFALFFSTKRREDAWNEMMDLETKEIPIFDFYDYGQEEKL
jgi:hypothetical protein